jgi:hypothetical protein
VLESEKMQLKKSGSKQSRVCSVWVHRTVRCARLAAVNWLVSGLHQRHTAKNHRTIRWRTGLSGEPTVSRANGRPRNPRATRGMCQRSEGAPDCPVGQRLQDCNGQLRQIRKEIRTGQCPVVHRSVRCARRQKARIAFLECSQRLLAALGL